MKMFAKMSPRSLAASAAVLLFASSAAYATCQQDCAAYANTEAEKVRLSVYSQVYQSCSRVGDPWSCRNAAETNSQNAYNSAYNYYYSNCTATNCGG